jgi:hypothetical protein
MSVLIQVSSIRIEANFSSLEFALHQLSQRLESSPEQVKDFLNRQNSNASLAIYEALGNIQRGEVSMLLKPSPALLSCLL